MDWSIEYKGVKKLISDWRVYNVIRVRKNQAADEVTFRTSAKNVEEDSVFEINEKLKIFRGTQLWFSGIITKTPLYSNVRQEFQQYVISGAWWQLEHLMYQQVWKEPLDPTSEDSLLVDITKTRVILGQNLDGDQMTIGEQIAEIVNYAEAAVGNLVKLSTDIDLPVYIPFDECKDLSCAEVIKRLLRWIPDAVVYFDYKTDIPTMHILRRDQMSSRSIELGKLSECNLIPRHDLQVPAVVLKFEKTQRANGKSWKTVEVQKFPQTATGTELNALVMTIPLEGTSSTYIQQKVETELIQINSETWWKKHLPALKNVSNFAVSEASREGILPNELLSGSIAGWMQCSAEKDTVRAKISYSSEEESVFNREFSIKISTTDATSKTYKNLVSYVSEETVPSNLAEYIYQSVNPLQYEGRCKWIEKEIDGDFLGYKFNISQGKEAWSTMGAVVQSVGENLDYGEITVTFGPAKHLGPDDLAELTKSSRRRIESRNHHSRKTAEAQGNSYVEQGTLSCLENSVTGPGMFKKMTFGDPDYQSRKVYIDTGEIQRDVTVKFREEYVSDSGVLKKRYSLASEPFALDELS